MSTLAILLMLGVFLLLAFTGTPVAVAMLSGALVGGLFADVSYATIIGRMFNGVNSVPLMAIPFFMLLAQQMDSSRIAAIIIKFAQSLVGHIRSGLAQVNALFSIMFAGISGSAAADVAANSRVLLPAMKREGYDPASSAALIAAASTIAIMIPPSVMAIIYGAATGVSVSALFLAGFIPGGAVGISLMIYSYFFVKSSAKHERAKFIDVLHAGRRATLPILVPGLILVGMLTGQFTATEAGMVAVIYTTLVVIPILARKHTVRFFRDLIEGGVLTSLPLLAVSCASVFAWLFTYFGGADVVANLMENVGGGGAAATLILLVLLMVIVGQFIDATPAIILFAPIILEIQRSSDINPVHMGVIVIVTMALGMVTPPYGISLLLATSFAKVPFFAGVRKMIPIYSIFAVIILGLILFPDIALWLPRIFVPQAAGCLPAPDISGGFICH
ncbi:TRAP transporter large permease [Nesterenkonia ebinurensis]|uniref:TRAP transporter large permease n=1 Tax=Nesterenkonia ebinurensis TaxID=2608252 RepID=UPI00123E0A5B|nr:TRAP transporter large permease [Nesterenkonia ebinurensis]